jgi:acyl dehydratase
MNDDKSLFFDDFKPGSSLAYGAYEVTKEEIVAFAGEFDPQYFHLDEEAARRSMLGGLAASGWHTCAILMRLNCDGYLNTTDGRGAPGIDEVKWLKPVRPGMVLGVRTDVLSARISQSRPSIGLVQFRFDVHDQSGESLLVQTNFVMIGRRGHKDAPKSMAKAQDATALLPFDSPGLLPPFSRIETGARLVLGKHVFSEEDVIRFARAYDPQPFHVDAAAAQAGPFGGLAASGWHTAAAWMRCMVDAQKRTIDAARSAGLRIPEYGPSPGFTNLRWLRPVYAGDTITFDSVAMEKRVTSRPEWGLVKSRNGGVNQHGVRVFEFDSAAFWKLD